MDEGRVLQVNVTTKLFYTLNHTSHRRRVTVDSLVSAACIAYLERSGVEYFPPDDEATESPVASPISEKDRNRSEALKRIKGVAGA